MAIQRRDDVWTQFDGAAVESVTVEYFRLSARQKYVERYARLDVVVDKLMIQAEHMNEFIVQLWLQEHHVMDIHRLGTVSIKMIEGWYCRGRATSMNGKLLSLMCPVMHGNGMPYEMQSVRPPQQRELMSMRGTFWDNQQRELNL